MSEYDDQAQKFLEQTLSTITITRYPEAVAPQAGWKGHRGFIYKVKLEREGKEPFSFDFFDSLANRESHKHPSNYSILASLDAYVDTDMTIDDFADEFGYSDGEHKISDVIKVYNACLEQTRELNRLYTEKELEMLTEIN